MTLILDAYRQAGVRGFVLSDNLGDEVRNDFGMLAPIAGFSAAAEHADAAVEQNNAWYHLFEEAPGGVVAYHTYLQTIPGYPVEPTHPSAPRRYYVYKDSVVSKILTGLAEVRRPRYHSLRGAGVGERPALTTRIDVVLAAVKPEDLKDDEDDIVLGRQLKGVDKRNNQLLFAPIATTIDPDRILCPIAVVSLEATDGPDAILGQLTTPQPYPRLPSFEGEATANHAERSEGHARRL